MIVSAHQPAYNPWLGYLHKILVSDIFVIMDDVQFEKNSFINRNKILQHGNVVMLTIPVKTKGYKDKAIRDLEIANHKWKIKHLKTIEQSYRKSKNFDIVFSLLKPIYELKSIYLIDYTNAFLTFLIDYLDINVNIVLASELNIKSRKVDYIVELTTKLGGRLFVFGSQGKNYVNNEYLLDRDIVPYFQNYNHPLYPQLSHKFYPNMGIIDLLFNIEKKDVKNKILENNVTKSELIKLYANREF